MRRRIFAILVVLAIVVAPGSAMAQEEVKQRAVLKEVASGWEAESENYIVRAPTEAAVKYATERAENLRSYLIWRWTGKRAGAPWTLKVRVCIHGSKEEYERAAKCPPGLVASGLTVWTKWGNHRLRTCDVHMYGGHLQLWSHIYDHEIAHTVQAQMFNGLSGDMPLVLQEGLAVCMEPPEAQRKTMQKIKNRLSWNDHLRTRQQKAAHATFNDVYGNGVAIVWFFREKFGADGDRLLVTWSRRAITTGSWQKAAVEVLGQSMDSLEIEFIKRWPDLVR